VKALSILQPWAWLIAAGHKDIENRRWHTHYRGWFLIHAGKTWGAEQESDLEECQEDFPEIPWESATIHRGGIIGVAEIVDCVTASDSEWFCGPFGFVIRNARPVVPFGYRGNRLWFDVPEISGSDDPILYDESARGRMRAEEVATPSPGA
jgi:hypothetical protein